MFAPQWTLKGEYLYYDLAALSYSLPMVLALTLIRRQPSRATLLGSA
jgi:hypothetical protein